MLVNYYEINFLKDNKRKIRNSASRIAIFCEQKYCYLSFSFLFFISKFPLFFKNNSFYLLHLFERELKTFYPKHISNDIFFPHIGKLMS